MDIRKLQRAIVDGLEDVKAANILVFNTEHLSPLFERVIIASGSSNRQTKSLAASVRDAVKASGFPVLRTEGESNGEWIIVDCGAAVAHIMQPAIRDYYHLEEIWGEKPVKMKLDTSPVRLVKASEEDQDAPAVKKATRTGVKGTVPRKAAARARPLGSVLQAPAKKSSARAPGVAGTVAGRAAMALAASAAERDLVRSPRKPSASAKSAVAPSAKSAKPTKPAPKSATAAGKSIAKTGAAKTARPAAGAVTRTVGTKGSAPRTETVSRTVIATQTRSQPPRGSRTAETSAGRAATKRPTAGRKTATGRTAAGKTATRAPARSAAASPARAPARKTAGSAPRKAAPRKTPTRK